MPATQCDVIRTLWEPIPSATDRFRVKNSLSTIPSTEIRIRIERIFGITRTR